MMTIDSCLERLCQKGCRAVWHDIAALERGDVPPEAAELNPKDRQKLLAELKTIMAVYQTRCRID